MDPAGQSLVAQGAQVPVQRIELAAGVVLAETALGAQVVIGPGGVVVEQVEAELAVMAIADDVVPRPRVGNDEVEHAAGGEHACHPFQREARFDEMFDHVVAADDVEALAGAGGQEVFPRDQFAESAAGTVDVPEPAPVRIDLDALRGESLFGERHHHAAVGAADVQAAPGTDAGQAHDQVARLPAAHHVRQGEVNVRAGQGLVRVDQVFPAVDHRGGRRAPLQEGADEALVQAEAAVEFVPERLREHRRGGGVCCACGGWHARTLR